MGASDVIRWNVQLAKLVNGVIPVMYDYAAGYRAENVETLRRTIPLPVDIDAIPERENRLIGKMKVFHGLNRLGHKGTRIIEEAFNELTTRYPNDIECNIAGRMPLAEYLKMMSTINVQVDQVNSYSYGMNAIYSLGFSQVVLSGAEPECLKEFAVTDCPVINVKPCKSDIIDKISLLLDRRSELKELGERARAYAGKIHACDKVAAQYLLEWSN